MNNKDDRGNLVDPVCGMRINHPEIAPTFVYEGETFYFCSDTCKQQFVAQPDRFAGVRQ